MSQGPHPGPDWFEFDQSYLWLPYTQMKTAPVPLPVVEASGVRIKLADGRELIDGIASWWTACHGYSHPHIAEAVSAQMERMPHVMLGGLVHEPAMRLAGRLARLLPGDLDHVFFSESGSVSVEIAMKMAVQYWLNQGVTGRKRFLSFKGGYHGDTFAAMAVCDPEEGMHTLFGEVLAEQFVIDLPHDDQTRTAFEAVLREHGDEIAGVLVEPLVQGAGGMHMHVSEVIKEIADACARHNVLLIADEIMTGFGRTGTLFACEQAGVVPDIMTLSKALTGGTLPLAATVARGQVFDAFLGDEPERALMHGPTYMGNPLACAAANASLDLFEQEPRLEQAANIEAQLTSELHACVGLPGVREVRVKGAVGAVELAKLSDLEGMRRRFVDEGVWIRPLGNVVYLTPPLVISESDLRHLTDAIVRVVAQVS